VDHRKRFVDLIVGWPGSVADGRVFSNSSLKANLERLLAPLPSTPVATKATDTSETRQEPIPAFILADSAYCSTSRLVPTFKTTECNRCKITKSLNYRLASIRYCIENAFGICKGRYRLLMRPLECAKEDVSRAIPLITSIFILHNFLIDEKDRTPIEAVETHELDVEDAQNNDGAENDGVENHEFGTREILLRHIRWVESSR